MKQSASVVLSTLLLLVLCCWVAPSTQIFCRCKPGTFTGSLFGAPFTIKIPENWNDVLIVYARDYSDEKPATANAFWPGFNPAFNYEEPLLARGYALIGSALSSGGWAVSNGINDLFALTSYFRLRHCWPKHTIIVGVSMGGVIAQKSIERFHFMYDAAIPTCSLSAGTTRTLDLSLRWNMAFGVAFGWPPFFGTPNDLSDDLTDEMVFGTYLGYVQNPFAFAGFEWLRLFMKIDSQALFYNAVPVPYLFINAKFATTVMAEIERRYGGPVTQNIGHEQYDLTELEKVIFNNTVSFVGGTMFQHNDFDGWLDQLNSAAYTFVANRKARAKLAFDGDFNGKVTGPVLTMHTTVDPLVPPQGETVYNQILSAAGRGNKLLQVYTDSIAGHCEFTPAHFVGAITAMHSWLETRVRPSADSDVFFPTSDGFARNFDPGPWLWN